MARTIQKSTSKRHRGERSPSPESVPGSSQSLRGRFIRTLYDSSNNADCLITAVSNSIQSPIITNLLMRLFDNFLTTDTDDIDVADLPDQDQAFGLMVLLGYIRGAHYPNETEHLCFTPIDLHFNSSNTRRIVGNIEDFTANNPDTGVVTIAANTPVYHVFNGTDQDRTTFEAISFKWVRTKCSINFVESNVPILFMLSYSS